MKQRLWPIILLSLSLGLAPLGAQAEDDIGSVKSEIKKLQQMLKNFRGERGSLSKKLQHSEQEISNIQRKIRNIKGELDEENNKLEQLHQERKTLDEAKKGQQQAVKEQLTRAYQTGRQQKIKVLLNQEDPAKLARMMVYYDYLNRANIAQVENYNHTINRLDQIEPDIEQSLNYLVLSKNKLDLQRQSLKRQQLSRRQTLAKIDKSIVDRDKQLRQQQQQLEKLLNAVAENIDNIEMPKDYIPFAKRRGKMAWPAKGKLLNAFGGKRNDTGIRWQGVNIAAAAGSKVKAIHRGRVVFSDWFRGLGMLVILDHGDGYLSLYAHNQAVYPSAGDWIQSGETIATVGSSGGQKRAALYFEVRHNGKPSDPKRWCK
ncbi:septal ring factor EnvC (AmiA/AmiB activator) [Sinobacterium caligoides]|uniref:Septal ring factor EnvC (AmiA/AmiB activator) n=1 Tax=Sinobacterium caligoides TaxID=933926 RepID=A0A3N2DGF4_9GAMM|nr:peptidoglycan DD-metalloendopeptidase family protein [Sinobacterium caligoides]ROR98876.1 septal ring factor EnvC (AmiA/AmiB activator) [Sinobacterium caligoides]